MKPISHTQSNGHMSADIQELQQRVKELDTFAHMLAHDLKNPIATIRGFAGLMIEYQLSRDEMLSNADAIVQEANRLEDMVDTILLFSQVKNGQEISTDPLDMHTIVENVYMQLVNPITESNAQITLPKFWVPAVGYAPWIKHVWMNLISNAIKYGGDPPVIDLGSTEQDNGYTLFWIRDNGNGIPAKHQNTIFEPFERFNEPHVDGHGLGLSIVKAIVEKLGGTITVESRVGEGSTFMFSLPSVD